ncbi:MAG: leucine-rich repeat domain-containing protein [Oscillibacter sp.]|nr:leucine-rich repeat domain-containing protein [Oscillibacter sp.]
MECKSCGSTSFRYDDMGNAVCEYCGRRYFDAARLVAERLRKYEAASDFEIEAGKLLKYKGASTEVDIPKGLGIKAICAGAFANQPYLSGVRIPEGVEVIENGAFSGCTSLSAVAIPGSVRKIGAAWERNQRNGTGAFEGCSGLRSVTFSEGLREIQFRAFAGCSSLETVSMPDSVEVLGQNAFWNCSALTSVRISRRVGRIEGGAFSMCSNLKEVVIPDGVTFLGCAAFGACASLSSVTIPDSVTDIEYGVFRNCENLHDVTASMAWKEKHWEKIDFLKKYDPHPRLTFFRKHRFRIIVGILWFIASVTLYITAVADGEPPLSIETIGISIFGPPLLAGFFMLMFGCFGSDA